MQTSFSILLNIRVLYLMFVLFSSMYDLLCFIQSPFRICMRTPLWSQHWMLLDYNKPNTAWLIYLALLLFI